jgi:leucyl aminopeptidase
LFCPGNYGLPSSDRGSGSPCRSRVDALVVVIGDRQDASLAAPLATLIGNAISAGDLVLKKGKSLYLYQPAGVAPRRLAVAWPAIVGEVVQGGGRARPRPAQVERREDGRDRGAGDRDRRRSRRGRGRRRRRRVLLYTHTKPSATPAWTPSSITLFCQKSEAKAVQQGVRQGSAVAAGVTMAREFGNRPGNYCTPTWLGQQAKKLAKQFGLEVDVLDKKDVEKLGMGSFLAVAQGSDEPLRFIVARYDGCGEDRAAGGPGRKGITFDTGGISLKPGADMDEMKFDMCGAASVLATLATVASLKARINLVCIVPACDNMPSGRAVKPGDVVTSMSGQTIEILNTDAEGRLILCDALTYAERFKPAVVVDVATLTGACVIALGHHHSGLFSADDGVAAQMLAASQPPSTRAGACRSTRSTTRR